MKNINIQFWTRDDLKKKLAGKHMFWEEDCPFCIDLKIDERIIWRWEHWAIRYNQYPYIMDSTHFMLIPIRHVHFSHEILAHEYCELPEAYLYISTFYGDIPYFSFTRESLNERSVEHIHTHFISGHLKRKTLVEMLKEQGFETSE